MEPAGNPCRHPFYVDIRDPLLRTSVIIGRVGKEQIPECDVNQFLRHHDLPAGDLMSFKVFINVLSRFLVALITVERSLHGEGRSLSIVLIAPLVDKCIVIQEMLYRNNKETKRLTALRDRLLPLLMNGQVVVEGEI